MLPCPCVQAEEITLTVGQAFDLAYKRFLEEGVNGAGSADGGDTDHKKQCLLLQRRVSHTSRDVMVGVGVGGCVWGWVCG